MKIQLLALFSLIILSGCGGSGSTDSEITVSIENEYLTYREAVSLYDNKLSTILTKDDYESTVEYNDRIGSELSDIGIKKVEQKLITEYNADTQELTIHNPYDSLKIEIYDGWLVDLVKFVPENGIAIWEYRLAYGDNLNVIYKVLNIDSTEAEKISEHFYIQAEFYFTITTTISKGDGSAFGATWTERKINTNLSSYRIYNKITEQTY